MARKSTCSVADCGRPKKSREWCTGHYARLMRGGDVQPDVPLKGRGQHAGKECLIEGCSRPARKSLACSTHYQRKRVYGDYRESIPLVPAPKPRYLELLPDGNYRCQRCSLPKPLESFHKRAGYPNARIKACRECRREYAKAWRDDNAERCREASKRNNDKNRDRRTERLHERRAAIYSRPRDEGVNRNSLRALDGDTCCYCGVDMDFNVSPPNSRLPNLATLEHVVPISRGGGHTWNNCALACWRCNTSKGARDALAWTIRAGHRLSS